MGVCTPSWDLFFGEAGRVNASTNEGVLSVITLTP
jgi:hypothetical protein